MACVGKPKGEEEIKWQSAKHVRAMAIVLTVKVQGKFCRTQHCFPRNAKDAMGGANALFAEDLGSSKLRLPTM